MVRVENLIVESKCFISPKVETQTIKKMLTAFMVKKNYGSEDAISNFFQDGFLTMVFYWMPKPPRIPYSLKIKEFCGLISKEEINQQMHFAELGTTRDDLPFKITFFITPSKLQDRGGFIINIRSEPVILFKMRQLENFRPKIDEFEYSNIIENNKQFLNEIMVAIVGTIIERPKAIVEDIKTPITEKLEKSGFEKISQLLIQGKLKIERGDIEDGLTDLRSSLEMFISELVEKIGRKPYQQNKIKDNLNVLKDDGYIDERICGLIVNILYNWLYRYLSDKPVHKREKLNLNDAKFMFSILEENMEYLLNKVISRA